MSSTISSKSNERFVAFQEMKTNFEFWMAFYGKTYSKFELVEGDFLDTKFREGILASTIIFVNNFAFGPEVDQRLKDVFADLADGSRIFSSKSFCALNFRITERNLSGELSYRRPVSWAAGDCCDRWCNL